ncbi:hypothetical protein C8J23_101156 [Shewanella chilikensis]|uniref:Tip attachment protein J domain-containing protein n=1 Tax=Shewanella chilikensis TaxID=558541 RepID=A0ABX5PTH2_9GAMM|nr:hypothetical protein C8J23_101156 [Shewanella chilikensis]
MMQLIFDTPWSDSTSPISLFFEGNEPVEPGLQLIFDTPWSDSTSPISLFFEGNEPVEPPVEPTPQVLGISVGVGWSTILAVEQQITLNSHSSKIGQCVNVTTHGSSHRDDTHIAWHAEPTVQQRLSQAWAVKKAVMRRLSVRWPMPVAHRSNTAPGWFTGATRREQTALRWRNNKALRCSPMQRSTTGHPQQRKYQLSWQGEATRTSHYIKWGFPGPKYICTNKWADMAPKSPVTLEFDEPLTEQQSIIELSFDELPMVCHWDYGGGFIPGNPVLPPLDLKVPIEPQIRRLYLMQPTLTCHRLSDNRELVITEVSITYSRSQFVTSGSIKFSSKGDALLAVDEVLRIGINGYEFYLLAEAPSSSEAWASNSYTSAARGRASQLAWPWKREISYHNQAARSFAGCLGDIVANSGWSIELVQVPDFVIPAGVCSVSGKTPLDAVAELAGLVGCMVDPDEDNSTLRILPRWTYTPWSMAAATADVNLHDAVIFNHSEQTERGQQCNAAWVRGEQQGVSVEVRLNGTAGDEPTDDISNMLIVDTQAARLAGTNAIADSGTKRRVSINTTVMADLPPLRPGQLIGITWRGEVYKALCDTVTINASMSSSGLTVRQNAGLIRQGT